MSQATLDDDDLFDEAATEIREDIEAALSAARESLPESDDVWQVDAKNTLGTCNGLRSALDVEDARTHLRDAKKWYTMGERADAFADADDLASEIESLEALFETIADAREQVSELAATLPELRGELDDARDQRESIEDHTASEEAEAE